MKTLLLLLLALPVLCKAQTHSTFNDSAVTFGRMTMEYHYVDSRTSTESNSLWMALPDSTLRIEGDTMKVIRMLLFFMSQKDSTIEAKNKLINSAIDFTNCVPDYWKEAANNCKWSGYKAQLRKNRFVIKTLKNNKPPCCK